MTKVEHFWKKRIEEALDKYEFSGQYGIILEMMRMTEWFDLYEKLMDKLIDDLSCYGFPDGTVLGDKIKEDLDLVIHARNLSRL